MIQTRLETGARLNVSARATDGCWFYPTVGSGVFLNVERSLALHHGPVSAPLILEPNSSFAFGGKTPSLGRFWFGPNMNHTRTKRGQAGRPFELFPQLAADHGFHTVQNQFKHIGEQSNDPHSELVVVTPPCMGGGELFGTANGGAYRTCVQSVQLRSGWRQNEACACDNTYASLVCSRSRHLLQ